MKHVAVMGYGTVGSGVYEVLTKNKDVVSKNVGEELNVKYVLDLREFPGDPGVAGHRVRSEIQIGDGFRGHRPPRRHLLRRGSAGGGRQSGGRHAGSLRRVRDRCRGAG